MASEVRVNQIQNRSGLGTVTFSDSGVSIAGVTTVGILSATGNSVFSGSVTATTFSGDLTGNVTGNATGLSGTPNITVGTVTGNLTGNVNANSLVVSGVSTVAAGSTAAPSISPAGDSDTGIFFPSADTIAFGEGGAEALRINSSGRIGIGVTNPQKELQINATTPTIRLEENGAGSKRLELSVNSSAEAKVFAEQSGSQLLFGTVGTERARIDSSGRLLVGTSSTSADTRLTVQGRSGDSTSYAEVYLQRGGSASSGQLVGRINFADSSSNVYADIQAVADAATGSGDYPGRLVFSTTKDAQSSPTEACRINASQDVIIGKTTTANGTAGTYFTASGFAAHTTSSATVGYFNRLANDGTLIDFAQDTISEGSISVSGTTVSYNGAHLSRWSQLPSGAEREEILRGSVLSNIDEMCEWGDEENEQLNRMKVSDVEGDKNVSGVFQCWDDDDDTYTNDFYCAMTGDFIIRIAEGVTVERGDLLMSAGDGTAKPQDDDIIRSKTIAKVTSTNVSCTYEDGSYCVPCVLMAC